MTEAEWLACTDSTPMLELLRGKASDRKLRLFAATCCRQIWRLLADDEIRNAVGVAEAYADGLAAEKHLLVDALSRHAVDVAESFADCKADDDDLDAAHDSAEEVWKSERYGWEDLTDAALAGAVVAYHATSKDADLAALRICEIAGGAMGRKGQHAIERAIQCRLLCDIIGNPFRPAALDPAWRTPTVTALATAAYEERQLPAGHLDAERLAVLADALEDAGCGDEQTLDHCRSGGPHVRGCWVVDLVLSKS